MDRGFDALRHISLRSFWGPLSGLGAAIALAAFLADRLSKWWLIDIFQIEDRVIVQVLPFFDLVMAWNKGISYGLFQADSLTGIIVLVGFASLVCAALFYWLATVNSQLMALALGFIIGGAMGNIYDRIAFGAVADFFSLHGYGYYWYIFNVADSWITIGVALMMYDAFFPAAGPVADPAGKADGPREGSE
jgi:signal peptidase II